MLHLRRAWLQVEFVHADLLASALSAKSEDNLVFQSSEPFPGSRLIV
jgi:hypothetical protein